VSGPHAESPLLSMPHSVQSAGQRPCSTVTLQLALAAACLCTSSSSILLQDLQGQLVRQCICCAFASGKSRRQDCTQCLSHASLLTDVPPPVPALPCCRSQHQWPRHHPAPHRPGLGYLPGRRRPQRNYVPGNLDNSRSCQ
jgi:hypothetical protein